MPDETTGSAAFPSERLESWKEIAAYLRRDIRTVQRWERAEGLPVRRQQHGERGSIHAFRSEIDAWRNARTVGIGPPPESARRRWPKAPHIGRALRARADRGRDRQARADQITAGPRPPPPSPSLGESPLPPSIVAATDEPVHVWHRGCSYAARLRRNSDVQMDYGSCSRCSVVCLRGDCIRTRHQGG